MVLVNDSATDHSFRYELLLNHFNHNNFSYALSMNTQVAEKDKAAIRAVYLAKHPNAFWVT